MGAGTASWSDISGTINFIHDSALAVARMANVLLPTVTNMSGSGMFDRKVWEWNSLAFSEHTEETDEASVLFDKDLLSTLSPKNYHARVDLTDERVSSDPDGARSAAALELGSAAAKHIDTSLASLFGTSTTWAGTLGPANAGAGGGTVTGCTISWRTITKGMAILANAGVPNGSPIYCCIHPYQWETLLASSSVAAASIAVAPGFQDRLMSANFFQVPNAYGVTFVVTNAMGITGTAAYGLMYVPQALALDTRKGFQIEPERDASKQAWELNASMWYAYGVRRPGFGVLLRHLAATPS